MTDMRGQMRLGAGHQSADVARVVRTLQDSGPIPLGELLRTPTLSDWSRQRRHDAVVSAWAAGVISIDSHDVVVAL